MRPNGSRRGMTLVEILAVVVILGLLADNLSGAPFMLYITAYLWIFLVVRVLSQILQVSLRFRTAIIVSTGVLIQNLIFVSAFLLLGAGSRAPVAATGTVIMQLIWAFTVGPILVLGFKLVHGVWERLTPQAGIGKSEAK